ncbi:hypothetical protein KPL71_001792 [Citrus sinensis]|uniref:Uncharacterized protein n=1 Tax=Citrus sinensis TaxID=2711 RepID=A0ACB8NZM6_CITSI|nr:hypothetical protein KPL71_001792 [Citrus sinensis]
MGDPVGMALKGDCRGFLHYFAGRPAKELLDYRTANGDSAFHIAEAMEDPRLIQQFLERLTPDTRLEALKQTDAFGNNETAIWLLNHDSSLAEKRATVVEKRATLKSDELSSTSDKLKSFTCLELLALMPAAFKSADDMKEMKSPFHYRTWIHCLMSGLPRCLDDDYNYKEDIETDKIDNRSGHTKKSRGCSWIEEIWKEKKMHEDAVALVKRLVEIERLNPSSNPQKAETTEQEISETRKQGISETTKRDISGTTKDEIFTICLGFGKGSDILGKKLVDFSAEELIEVLRIKDGTNDAVEDGKNATTDDRTLHFAASNGITEIMLEMLQQDPQALLSNVNELTEQNILHVAVERRQHKVFEFIMKEMQLYVPKWAAGIDKYGYTLLHNVADMKHYKQGTRPGPVLQFQEELQWFERVKEIMPRHFVMHRDEKKNITASDLFDLTHEDQLRKVLCAKCGIKCTK